MNTNYSTKERLNQFFSKFPVEAKKSLGQNFLVSDYAVSKMIGCLMGLEFQNLIEIGPGPGALTDILKSYGEKFKVLELDNFFYEYWVSQGVNAINVDALQWDWKTEVPQPSETVLISNLPYQISSSIVIDRSMDESPLKAMILMFQKEVAQKLKMNAGTSEFGMLSVVAQVFWNIETVCDLSPRDFLPAPKIASRVLCFTAKTNSIEDRKSFLTFCKAGFAQKRKLLKKICHR